MPTHLEIAISHLSYMHVIHVWQLWLSHIIKLYLSHLLSLPFHLYSSFSVFSHPINRQLNRLFIYLFIRFLKQLTSSYRFFSLFFKQWPTRLLPSNMRTAGSTRLTIVKRTHFIRLKVICPYWNNGKSGGLCKLGTKILDIEIGTLCWWLADIRLYISTAVSMDKVKQWFSRDDDEQGIFTDVCMKRVLRLLRSKMVVLWAGVHV